MSPSLCVILNIHSNEVPGSMAESVYNLIPKDRPVSARTRYQSKYPPNMPPTASTICIKTTSKPGVANLAGEILDIPLSHTQYGEAKTLGYLKGERGSAPDNFRLKHTGTMGDNSLPEAQDFSYNCRRRKDSVPKITDKPIQGLKSSKNFVVENAVDNILSTPKCPPTPVDWTKKKNFGKVPNYLNRIKEHVEAENRMRENLKWQQSDDRYCLSQGQVQTLQSQLKRRWHQVNKEYQGITHIQKVDTIGLKRKKEDCEKELNELQVDIKKLDKIYVFVRGSQR